MAETARVHEQRRHLPDGPGVGNPWPGIEVRVDFDPSGINLQDVGTFTTDANGEVKFYGVLGGYQYRGVVLTPGFVPGTRTATLATRPDPASSRPCST